MEKDTHDAVQQGPGARALSPDERNRALADLVRALKARNAKLEVVAEAAKMLHYLNRTKRLNTALADLEAGGD